jgi:hypothetical protein
MILLIKIRMTTGNHPLEVIKQYIQGKWKLIYTSVGIMGGKYYYDTLIYHNTMIDGNTRYLVRTKQIHN